MPEFWVWKLSESGPAEIARKVGNLPEFWVWKLPEIKASFFAAALKKNRAFFHVTVRLSAQFVAHTNAVVHAI